MYARRFEKRPVDNDGSIFMIHAKRWVLVREMFTVHKQRKIADVLMLSNEPK